MGKEKRQLTRREFLRNAAVFTLAMVATACKQPTRQIPLEESDNLDKAPHKTSTAQAVEIPSPTSTPSGLIEIQAGGEPQKIPLKNGGYLHAIIMYAPLDSNYQPAPISGFIVPNGEAGYLNDKGRVYAFIPTTLILEKADKTQVPVYYIVLFPQGKLPDSLPNGWVVTDSSNYPGFRAVAVTDNSPIVNLIDIARIKQ